LAALAQNLLYENQFVIHDKLEQEYQSTDRLWSQFYKDFSRFKGAFDAEVNKEMQVQRFGRVQALKIAQPLIQEKEREPSKEMKEHVLRRDNFTCQCCGYRYNKSFRSRKLETDHIVAYYFGGDNSESNLQVLCSPCNQNKKINSINFTISKTPMTNPKEWRSLPFTKINEGGYVDGDSYVNLLQRIVNSFYHCNAVAKINTIQQGKFKFRDVWEIELYSGNPPEWLIPHKQVLIELIKDALIYVKLKDIKIR
jgi:5-methylcytosine-specific restriction endonuclease McrA